MHSNISHELRNTETTTSESDDHKRVKTTLVSRNITVNGKRTSVRLEPEMWAALREISRREECSIHDVCSLIAMRKNPQTSLTAAIRVFLMLYFRAASTEDGHSKAGHGDFNRMRERARISENSVERFKQQVKNAAHTGHINAH